MKVIVLTRGDLTDVRTVAAPGPDCLCDFVKFIDEELALRGVNTLILRVDHNYAFEWQPELCGGCEAVGCDLPKTSYTDHPPD